MQKYSTPRKVIIFFCVTWQVFFLSTNKYARIIYFESQNSLFVNNWKMLAEVFNLFTVVLGKNSFCCSTALSLLGYVPTSTAHWFSPILLGRFAPGSSVWLDFVCWLNQRHRFSVGFSSGLWLGQCRTFSFLCLTTPVALALCLGPLSCLKVTFLPSFLFFFSRLEHILL